MNDNHDNQAECLTDRKMIFFVSLKAFRMTLRAAMRFYKACH